MGRFTKLIKENNNKTNLATHPLFNAEDSKKRDYFQSLVFVCVEDDNFSDEEKEYLKVSLVAMGLDEALFDEFEKFTQDSDEDELLALIDRLKEFTEDEKLSFLVDVCVVAFKDGEFDESEMELFEEYLEILEMKDSRQTILYLAKILNEKDIDGAISFSIGQKEIFEKFKYMFELLQIDVEKEMKKIFEWVSWEYDNQIDLSHISAREFCIYVNSLLISCDLVKTPDSTKFSFNKIIVLPDIEQTNLEYDEDEKLFFYQDEIKKESIEGFYWTNKRGMVNIATYSKDVFYASWVLNYMKDKGYTCEVKLENEEVLSLS